MLLLSCNGLDKSGKETSIANQKDSLTTENTMIWVDYSVGELPPLSHTEAVNAIITRWGINYKRIDAGCTALECKAYDIENKRYFNHLETKYGKDWRNRFDKEVAALEQKLQDKHQKK